MQAKWRRVYLDWDHPEEPNFCGWRIKHWHLAYSPVRYFSLHWAADTDVVLFLSCSLAFSVTSGFGFVFVIFFRSCPLTLSPKILQRLWWCWCQMWASCSIFCSSSPDSLFTITRRQPRLRYGFPCSDRHSCSSCLPEQRCKSIGRNTLTFEAHVSFDP